MTTQRDRLIAVLHDSDCSCLAGPCSPDDVTEDYATHADALLARGVRVVDVETLAAAIKKSTDHGAGVCLACSDYSDRDTLECRSADILDALDTDPDR